MGHQYGGMMGMGGMMGAWMVFGVLFALALLVLVVLASIWLAKRLSPGRTEMSTGPEEVLRRRYAAGEIDREEFLRTQRDLSGR
jgi:putative membrane protein